MCSVELRHQGADGVTLVMRDTHVQAWMRKCASKCTRAIPAQEPSVRDCVGVETVAGKSHAVPALDHCHGNLRTSVCLIGEAVKVGYGQGNGDVILE